MKRRSFISRLAVVVAAPFAWMFPAPTIRGWNPPAKHPPPPIPVAPPPAPLKPNVVVIQPCQRARAEQIIDSYSNANT